ncbi:hypothetical protein C7974DRAFT_167805 [Boeremia exigua]|uniref:uncharacterized protein n=1 Tax=Boeremia exigua TaxID=749465 RepID=UPI001E8E0A58|nr:uncharacterized protein C7974DRAFT_167805 [Boeremia exigua]KAH6633220.1 hypothetical protein C7974DRAFT_167805 [Boeremia exigua]
MGDSLCLVLVLVGSLTLEVDEVQNRRDSDFAPAKRGGWKALKSNLGKIDPLSGRACTKSEYDQHNAEQVCKITRGVRFFCEEDSRGLVLSFFDGS